MARIVVITPRADAQIVETPETAPRAARDGKVIVIERLRPRPPEAEGAAGLRRERVGVGPAVTVDVASRERLLPVP